MKALQREETFFYDFIPGDETIYPESDGKPMSDNTKQYRWIVKIKEGLESMFADEDVFVAADIFWYPVKDDIHTRKAPDVMAAFGRPKGDRGSYIQHKEGNIPPQVVFEILSPGNRAEEMDKKFDFYELHGVEEYYVYDPDKVTLEGWVRLGAKLRPVENIIGWVSPRLKIRFEISDEDLVIWRPDGRRFLTPLETEQMLHSEIRDAEQEKMREKMRAEQEKMRAEQEKMRADNAEKKAEAEREKAQKLAEKLRELGIDPENLI